VAEDVEAGASEASEWDSREREERLAALTEEEERFGEGGDRRIFVILSCSLFVQSYSHLAYLDYGGALFYPDPVCRPAPKVGLDGSRTKWRSRRSSGPRASGIGFHL